MRKISHRGNVSGPNKDTENTEKQIFHAISLGLDVEVDIWRVNEILFLGHDNPEVATRESFVDAIADRAWFHCKNLDALNWFAKSRNRYQYFWHQNDDYTLTSNGYIWTYPGKEITSMSIIVVLDNEDLSKYKNVHGVCSDYFS